MAPRPLARGWLAALIALVLVVTGLVVWRLTATPGVRAVRLAGLFWIYDAHDLGRLRSMDPGLIGETLDGPGSYVLEQPGGAPVPKGAIPAESFFGSGPLRTAIAAGTVLPGVRAVLDDPELWPATPYAERRDPLPAMQVFGQLARAAGFQPILAPGRDLTATQGAICGKPDSRTLTEAYLACRIPAAARYCTVFVIQAAPVETRLAQLTRLVRRASWLARRANPHVVVIATLSTAPDGRAASPARLLAAARVMLPYVRGFMLNTTDTTDGQLISFLRALADGS